MPWPDLQDKMAMTESFLKVMWVLGRKCCACGTTKMFDFSWRITRKSDLLRCVLPTKQEFDRVLKNPEQYQVFCLVCAANLRMQALAWIHHPYTNTNPCGGVLAPWNEVLHKMYPADREELYRKIDSHEIQSLTYKMRMPNGKYAPIFLRARGYYLHVARNPRPLAYLVCEAARRFVEERTTLVDTAGWGMGRLSGIALVETEQLSTEFREWLINEISSKVGSGSVQNR